MATDKKICRRCKDPKDATLANFGQNRTQKDGLHWNCKPCAKIAAKESRLRKKQKAVASAAAGLEQKLQSLTPAARLIAKEMLSDAPVVHKMGAVQTAAIREARYKADIKRLRTTKPEKGSEWVVVLAIKTWEDHLCKLIGQEAFDNFIATECN